MFLHHIILMISQHQFEIFGWLIFLDNVLDNFLDNFLDKFNSASFRIKVALILFIWRPKSSEDFVKSYKYLTHHMFSQIFCKYESTIFSHNRVCLCTVNVNNSIHFHGKGS